MQKQSELVPPYGPVTRLKTVFDFLSTHSFSQISSSIFKDIGFSGTDAALAVSALKFLGLIDLEGNKTAYMPSLQLKGLERQRMIEEMIKKAYSKLFETVQEPNKLSRDDLHNDFILVYKLTARQTLPAILDFLWLCKEAGLEISEDLEVKERKSGSVIKKTETQRKSKVLQQTPKKQEIFDSYQKIVELGEFKLVLPDDWDVVVVKKAIATGKFSQVYKELETLNLEMEKKDENIGGVPERS